MGWSYKFSLSSFRFCGFFSWVSLMPLTSHLWAKFLVCLNKEHDQTPKHLPWTLQKITCHTVAKGVTYKSEDLTTESVSLTSAGLSHKPAINSTWEFSDHFMTFHEIYKSRNKTAKKNEVVSDHFAASNSAYIFFGGYNTYIYIYIYSVYIYIYMKISRWDERYLDELSRKAVPAFQGWITWCRIPRCISRKKTDCATQKTDHLDAETSNLQKANHLHEGS